MDICIENFEYIAQFVGMATLSDGVVCCHWSMLHLSIRPRLVDYFMTQSNYYPGRE